MAFYIVSIKGQFVRFTYRNNESMLNWSLESATATSWEKRKDAEREFEILIKKVPYPIGIVEFIDIRQPFVISEIDPQNDDYIQGFRYTLSHPYHKYYGVFQDKESAQFVLEAVNKQLAIDKQLINNHE